MTSSSLNFWLESWCLSLGLSHSLRPAGCWFLPLLFCWLSGKGKIRMFLLPIGRGRWYNWYSEKSRSSICLTFHWACRTAQFLCLHSSSAVKHSSFPRLSSDQLLIPHPSRQIRTIVPVLRLAQWRKTRSRWDAAQYYPAHWSFSSFAAILLDRIGSMGPFWIRFPGLLSGELS